MLRVLLTSGRELAAVTTEDLLGKDVEGHITVCKLKQYLHGLTGHSRFQQRLMCDGRQLRDDDSLEPPLCMQLVIVSFCEASPLLVQRLEDAVALNNTEVVEELLKQPMDPNVRGMTFNGAPQVPMHVAAIAGSVRSAELLLEAGASKDEQDCNGDTPMHKASMAGQAAFVQWLLDAGADISKTDDHGHTPLVRACAFGRLGVVRVLTGCVRDELMPNFDFALNWACMFGHMDVARHLVQAGADKDKAGDGGDTPLHTACAANQLQVVQYVVHAGSRTDAENEQGNAPMHHACQFGNLTVVQYFVESLHQRDMLTLCGRSPLHAACAQDGPGVLEVVDYLIRSGANVNQPNSMGLTPLGIASVQGHLSMVRRLLLAGADVGRVPRGHSALACASLERHVEIVKLLGEAQAQPKRRRFTFKRPVKPGWFMRLEYSLQRSEYGFPKIFIPKMEKQMEDEMENTI